MKKNFQRGFFELNTWDWILRVTLYFSDTVNIEKKMMMLFNLISFLFTHFWDLDFRSNNIISFSRKKFQRYILRLTFETEYYVLLGLFLETINKLTVKHVSFSLKKTSTTNYLEKVNQRLFSRKCLQLLWINLIAFTTTWRRRYKRSRKQRPTFFLKFLT